jgi:hypothetical protein
VPASFAEARLAAVAGEHSVGRALRLPLAASGLSLRGVFWEAREARLRPRRAHLQRLLCLGKCGHVPAPSKEHVEVLGRSVRVCLFDGVAVRGNVHTVRAHLSGKDERTWHFHRYTTLLKSCSCYCF